jgi:hypothetical protein
MHSTSVKNILDPISCGTEERHLNSWASASSSIPQNKTSIITHTTKLLRTTSPKRKEKGINKNENKAYSQRRPLILV